MSPLRFQIGNWRVVPATVLIAALNVAPLPAGDRPSSIEPQNPLDVPYVPTPEPVVARMLEMAGVKADDFVIDLGSGDGRIVIAAARDHGARALGVDLDRELLQEARANAEAAGVGDMVTLREQDLVETDLSRADVLTMFLTSSVNLRLRPRILEEMRPGARVVSHLFRMGEWEPDDQDMLMNRGIYFWMVPARVEGRWRFETPGGPFTVAFAQSFQRIEGTADIDGDGVPVAEAKLRGAEIRFALERDGNRQIFNGLVEGNRMRAVPPLDDAADIVPVWRAVKE